MLINFVDATNDANHYTKPRVHDRVNPYPGACKHQTEMFSDREQDESFDRSSFSSIGSLFHARGAATEKALSPIRRRVHGTMRLPPDKVRSVDRSGILATDVRRS